MKKWLFLLLTVSVCFNVKGQKYGYIQTNDKYISGFVYPGSGSKKAHVCKFSKYSKGEVVEYTPAELSAYGYGNTDFVSMPVKPDTVKMFLQVLVKGDHPVYYLRDKKEKIFFISSPRNELVRLNSKDGEYKHQLAAYFEAPDEAVKYIHGFYTKRGILKSANILKGIALTEVVPTSETIKKESKVLTIKQKRWMLEKKPIVSISLQSGVTTQRLPLDLHAELPENWDMIKATSPTYSLAVDLPILKYWPLTFHQEICFNKFVTDYTNGSEPPDFQLIQNFSVISLPAMLRYTIPCNKLTLYVNAGLQLDVALNKNNIGMLIVGNGTDITNPATTYYYDYNTIQTGVTIGFGGSFKLNKSLSLISEFRYSRVYDVLPDKSGTERQAAFKIGIVYPFFKKEK